MSQHGSTGEYLCEMSHCTLCSARMGVWGVWGVWGVCGVWGVWGTFNIPRTALVATLDTYDFMFSNYPHHSTILYSVFLCKRPYAMLKAPVPSITEVKQH
jgi:hypothetical protein